MGPKIGDSPKYKVVKADGTDLDCPAVVFLAKDLLAIAALEKYQDALIEYHPNTVYRQQWFNILRVWRHWRRVNEVLLKLAD